MGIYENPGSYAEDPVDIDPLFPQTDPVQRAAEEQRDRLKKIAEQRAERESREAKKKAEKDARIAQKMADKVAKGLEKKADNLSDTSEEAKDKVAKAKDAIVEMSDAVESEVSGRTSVATEGNPVEMAFTDGSEYIAELKEGEEAIFDLSQSVERIEDVIDIADEVTEKAEALAKARAALSEVVSDDMGVGSTSLQESVDVFGVQGPAQDIRDRLRTAWEPEQASTEQPIQSPIDALSAPADMELADADSVRASNLSYSERSATLSSYAGYETPSTINGAQNPESSDLPVTSTQSKTLPLSRGIRSATAFAGGFIAGRAGATKRELERVETSLQSQTQELRSDIAQNQSPMQEILTPLQVTNTEYIPRSPAPETLRPAAAERIQPVEAIKLPEVPTGNQDAIPSWIRQVESDVKRGKVLELKKWQRDVLKAQHPELLTRYDKLDAEYRLQLKNQTIEFTKSEQPGVLTKFASQAQPGDLPSFSNQPSMPAFMRPPVPMAPPTFTAPVVPQPVPSAYEYATQQAGESVFSSAYITIVTIGGLVFGAFLISVFGL